MPVVAQVFDQNEALRLEFVSERVEFVRKIVGDTGKLTASGAR